MFTFKHALHSGIFAASITILLFSYSTVLAQNNVTGYVYEDLNNNAIKDKNEKGIQGVAVTNGKEVSLSNEDGSYSLPANDDMIVSVIKPAGYAVPVDANNQPQFFTSTSPMGHLILVKKGFFPRANYPNL